MKNQMIRIISWVVLLSFLNGSLFQFQKQNAFAQEKQTESATSGKNAEFGAFVESYMQTVQALELVCTQKVQKKAIIQFKNKKTERRETRILIADDRAVTSEDNLKQVIHCGDVARMLADDTAVLKEIVSQIQPADKQPDCEENCDTYNLGSQVPLDTRDLDSIQKQLDLVSEQDQSCQEGENTPLLSGKCGKEILCNLGRSVQSILKPVMWAAKLVTNPKDEDLFSYFNKDKRNAHEKMGTSCLDSSGGRSDCLKSIIVGFVTPFITLGKSLVQLGKLAKDGLIYTIKHPIKAMQNTGKFLAKGWKWVSGLWEKNSDNARVAGDMTDEEYDQYNKDDRPWYQKALDKVWKVVEFFFGDLIDKIKNDFGCMEWEGAAHTSKCLKPFKGFDCATCDQKLSVICGVAGYAGGQYTMFVGGKQLMKNVGALSKEAMGGIKNTLASKFPRFTAAAGKAYGYASKPFVWVKKGIGNVTQKIGTATQYQIDKLKEFLANNKTVQALLEFKGKTSTFISEKIVDPVANTKIVKISLNVADKTGELVKPAIDKLSSWKDSYTKFVQNTVDAPFEVFYKNRIKLTDAGLMVPKNKVDDMVDKVTAGDSKGLYETKIGKENLNLGEELANDDYLRGAKELDVHLSTSKMEATKLKTIKDRLQKSQIKFTSDPVTGDIHFNLNTVNCK